MLDVVLTYDCNLACDYCTVTPEMRRRSLTAEAVVAEMRAARAQGYDAVSFTGGEPTIRRDLVALVRAARTLGFGEIKIHSNGLVYAQERNVDRLVAAGANLFHVSVHTHLEEAYDRMVRMQGAWRLMVAGLGHLVARRVFLRAELIITSETWPRLVDAVGWLAELGVRRVDFGYVSLTDGNRENVASLPRMSEAAPALRQALAAARAAGLEARSLYVPRCLLGEDVGHAHDPGADRVKVVTPDAVFDLDRSRLAGTVHAPACEMGCAYRAICPGIRPDYLERFGAAEFVPVVAPGTPSQGGSGTSSSS